MSSVSGFRYYIVFIDDHSMVYLLRDKSHVSTVIKKNFNEIKTQFSSTNFFRTDNALKFVQFEISEFCASRGIVHQTFCLHT